MIEPTPDRRIPISPALAVRVAVLGVVALVLFAIVFFRLWYLQVLSGDQYLAQAQTNRVRRQVLPAPRGDIVDRNGRTLIKNKASIAVRLDPTRLPESEKTAVGEYGAARIARAQLVTARQVKVDARKARRKGRRGPPIPPVATPPVEVPQVPADLKPRFERLSMALGLSIRTIQARTVRSLFLASYAPITLRVGVGPAVRNYIAERQRKFKGVKVEPFYLREYPQGDLAAQLVGTVNEISTRQLKEKAYKGIRAGTRIGQSGLESQYDSYLRGRDGFQRLYVNAQGGNEGQGTKRDPVSGRQVKLSLDLSLQRAAQSAYRTVAGGQPGAFVAMDPRNGEVLAMGSFPTFDPSILAKPISQARYDAIFAGDAAPQFNRAAGAYPTGSTFKPFTALAALKSGITSPGRQVDDTGCIKVGPIDFCNAKKAVNGQVDLRDALKVSSDVYFYEMGKEAGLKFSQPIIQDTARRLGLGRTTGLDLPGEVAGNVPDERNRASSVRQEIRCRKRHGLSTAEGFIAAQAAAGTCFARDTRPWTLGDNVNTAIGQGDVQASPLQMAVAYSAIANGGRVPRPHLGIAVDDDQGRELQRLPRPAARKVQIDPAARQVIMDGLHDAASAPGGTSTDVFKDWDQGRHPIFGKTGTAEKGLNRQDQSWYVAYSYDGSPSRRPLVVAVTAERGGFGAATAAPIARLIFSKWFGVKAQVVRGSSTTR